MWWMLDGFSLWIIGGVAYGIAVIYFWIKENGETKRRLAEREERRRIQNAEWEHQVRTNPTLRLLLALHREHRRERREAHEAMEALRDWMPPRKPKEKVNWKEEGF